MLGSQEPWHNDNKMFIWSSQDYILFFCYFHIFALNLKYSQKLETAAVKTLGGNDI